MKLKREILQVYGDDDVVLDKQQKMNSLNDEIAILQKKFNEADAERKSIESYREKMLGTSSESSVQVKEASRELATYKKKHKEMMHSSKEIAENRDEYFKAVKEN